MKKWYKWCVVAMLSCAFFFHQADRALFGLLTIPIQQDLGLTDVQIGWINTVLSWTLAAMTMVAGFAGDRFSRKWLITGSLLFWSLMTVCMGFVGDWRIFGFTIPAFLVVMFFRSIATGGGESFYAPSAMALIGSHHKETRSVAFSIHQAALYIGLMTSGVLVAWALGILGSWRNVFIVFGGAGFVLGIFFIWALKDNEDVANGQEPRGEIRKGSPLGGLRAFFFNPSAICATIGFVAIVFVNNAYLFWAPKFMAQKFGCDVGTAGAQTMLWHHLFAFAAIMVGGIATDHFVKRRPRFRLALQMSAMLLGAPCLVLVGFSSSIAATVVMTALYGVFRGTFEVNTHASVFDVVAPEHRSTVVGCMVMSAFFFGGLSGVAMGKLSALYGVRGFEIGFAILGAAYMIGAAAVATSFFFTFKRDRIALS
ncbi:MAG: MFS transporter [Kiritimatiellae bacterium]|nr:MFS transporter [Kiritimatiellia bacterium]